MSVSTTPEAVPRILAAPPTLPARPRHFVGRGEEIVHLAHAFERGPGAVVWGAGGIGKTTLALEATYRQEWRFPDGIFWFPLAGGRVGFSDLLTVHLGAPPGTPAHQLHYLLAHSCSLLLLDSFESACQSAVVGGGSLFTGVAPGLILAGVPAVTAMQFTVRADVAEVFAKQFYLSLAGGKLLGEAVADGRRQISLARYGYAWFTPVLYLRSRDGGRLFEWA